MAHKRQSLRDFVGIPRINGLRCSPVTGQSRQMVVGDLSDGLEVKDMAAFGFVPIHGLNVILRSHSQRTQGGARAHARERLGIITWD